MKTYHIDLSNINRIYVAAVVFILCFLVGVNVNFDHFDRLAKLPPDRNESYFIKEINFGQKSNLLDISFKMDYIFKVTYEQFISNLHIIIRNDQNSWMYGKPDFHLFKETKNYCNFSILMPDTGHFKVEVWYHNNLFRRHDVYFN